MRARASDAESATENGRREVVRVSKLGRRRNGHAGCYAAAAGRQAAQRRRAQYIAARCRCGADAKY